MAQGRLRAQRSLLIAQAGLIFFDGRSEDLEEFLATGWLPGGGEVLPYDPAFMQQLQREWEERRGGSQRH